MVVVVVVVVDVLVDVDGDVLDAVEEVGAIEVRVVEVGVVEVAASSVVGATAAASASADSASEPPHPARTIDARAAVDVSSTAAVRLHARRRSWPFTAIGAVILRRRRGASAGASAIRSAWRTQAGIPIPRWLAPPTTRFGGSADSTAPTRSRWCGRYCGNASRHLEIRTADGCRSIPRWRPTSSTAAARTASSSRWSTPSPSRPSETRRIWLPSAGRHCAHFWEPNDAAVTKRCTGLGTR